LEGVEYINIALTKGRLAEKTFELFERIGITFDDYHPSSRKLIFTSEKDMVKVVFVKAGDVPIYVEKGAADIGVAGKDTIMESESNLYEIMDLGFGKCKFAVAASKEFEFKTGRKLRVATKYPNVAKNYFKQKGEPIEIIKLTGSVELAPLMGLSDVIVDIVESGKTLKENGLVVIEDICDISARLIINKVSFKTKSEKVERIIKDLKCLIGGKEVG
jgi:ATP phosphoribosyltransferase